MAAIRRTERMLATPAIPATPATPATRAARHRRWLWRLSGLRRATTCRPVTPMERALYCGGPELVQRHDGRELLDAAADERRGCGGRETAPFRRRR